MKFNLKRDKLLEKINVTKTTKLFQSVDLAIEIFINFQKNNGFFFNDFQRFYDVQTKTKNKIFHNIFFESNANVNLFVNLIKNLTVFILSLFLIIDNYSFMSKVLHYWKLKTRKVFSKVESFWNVFSWQIRKKFQCWNEVQIAEHHGWTSEINQILF